MNKGGILGLIGIIIVLLVVGLTFFVGDGDEDGVNESGEVEIGIKCVAASCCHANSCVLESEAPDCSGAFCSLSCELGTMDCGQGSCGVVDEVCEVIWNE